MISQVIFDLLVQAVVHHGIKQNVSRMALFYLCINVKNF